MTNKTSIPSRIKQNADDAHPGMMGDGTEEQSLDQPGKPAARIKKEEVDAAFDKKRPQLRQGES